MKPSDNGNQVTHRRNPPHCPAQEGNGIDIADSEFELCMDGCNPFLHFDWQENDVGIGYAHIEIYAYFIPTGALLDDDDERLNDGLISASLVVPACSRISRIAHTVNADASGELQARAADLLRERVAQCACQATGECPALNKDSLVFALQRAMS